MATDPNDPFAAMGGGVKLASGGWVPSNHPLAQQEKDAQLAAAKTAGAGGAAPNYEDASNAWLQGEANLKSTGASMPMTQTSMLTPAAAPAATPAPTPAAGGAWDGGTGFTPQQAAAAGLGWVPKDHPLYGTAGYVGSTPATGGAPAPAAPAPAAGGAAGYAPPNLAPGTPGATPVDTQNQNAQTYSQTPGAAPTNATTNQGTQDVVRNEYLQSIQKGTNVDTNDPNFRQQSDAYASAQERQRRNAIDDSVQASFAQGTRGSGADNIERRMADEQAARNVGGFEADLVGRELQSRRDEVKNALSSLGGMINSDQMAALQRELAALDASIKQQGIQSSEKVGMSDIDLRNKLGTGALNVDLLRAILQNQQFGISSGIQMGDLEAKYSGMFK